MELNVLFAIIDKEANMCIFINCEVKMPEINSNSVSATKLREILLDRDMTQTELATLLNEDRSVVSLWITGRRLISEEKKEKICRLLEIELSELSDYSSSVPIVGETSESMIVLNYSALDRIPILKLKNSILPTDLQGIIYNSRKNRQARQETIFCFRNTPGKYISENKIHEQADNATCFCEHVNGTRFIADVYKLSNTGFYSLYHVHSQKIINNCNSIELHFAMPIWCQFTNWRILNVSFDNNLYSEG